MDAWANFFLGELGAAAALAGLLFVSISVNQTRILALGRMADRGADALLQLLLVVIVSSVMLIPAQPRRLVGAEILVGACGLFAAVARLQRSYLRDLAREHRRQALKTVILGQIAVWCDIAAGVALVWRDDWTGAYLLAAGVLLSFVTAGMNAWVLLIEINR